MVGCLFLTAASMCAACGDRLASPEPEPDDLPEAGVLDECPLPGAVDLEEAAGHAVEFAVCGDYVGANGRAECSYRDVWLVPADYGPDGVEGPWTIGRPVADCDVLDDTGAVTVSVVVALPTIEIPPMEATWGSGPPVPDECHDQSQVIVHRVHDAVADAKLSFENYLGCLGAGPDEQIVECWGSVALPTTPRMYIFDCRIQNLAADYANAQTVRATSPE